LYLESLILEHSLDGSILTGGRKLGLEYHAKGAVSNYLALSVLQVSGFARDAVLGLLADDFYGHNIRLEPGGCATTATSLPPIRRVLKAAGRLADIVTAFVPRRTRLECGSSDG
jgi:hypothetical protein